MKVTQKLRRYIALFLVLTMAFTVGINAVPQAAYAAQTNPGDQLERWLMYKGMRACLENPDFSPNTPIDDNGDRSLSDINNGNILPGASLDGDDSAGGGGTKEGFGYLGPDLDGGNDNDGTVGCATGNIFVRGATAFGFDSVVDLVCAMNRGLTELKDGGRIEPSHPTDCEASEKFSFDGGGGDIFQRALDWALANEGDKDRPSANINDNNGSDYSYKALLYLIGKRSLETFCGDGATIETASKNDKSYDGDDDIVSVDIVASNGTVRESQSYPIADSERDENSKVDDVYYNQGGNANEAKDLRCHEMAAMTRDNSEAYASWRKANPDADPDAGGVEGAPEGATIGAECAGFSVKEAFSLNWVLCPLIHGTMSAANALENQISGMLCINETDIFAGADMTCEGTQGSADSQQAFHDAWNVFRVLALGMLAIAGLIMILSQGLGFEIFDAYTIKKTLPRILVAAIAISLSWPLLEGLVTFSNALGIGVRSLIYQPFVQAGIDDVVLAGGEAAIATILGIGSAVAAFAILGPIGILSFVATALLAIIIAFFVLVIRNILVILLVIIAPIAIVMYILPNTEKWSKTWWDWLFKALLAFPIITAMIAIGHVFAAITSQKGGGLLTTVVAFVAYFAPYFLIPAAFRFAGGALATLGGFVNDRSRGGFDRLKKYRGQQSAKRLGVYGDKIGAAYNQKRATAYRGLNAAASKRTGLGNKALKFAANRVEGIDNMEAVMSELQARRIKQLNDQIESGVDSDIRGLTVNKRAALAGGMEATARSDGATYSNSGLFRVGSDGTRQFQSLGGAWVNEADVDAGHKRWGGDHAAQQTALAYEMRKAMTETQIDGIGERFQTLAQGEGGWNMSDTQAGGAWIGAAFANQNQHLQYKGTDWKSGELKGTTFHNDATNRDHTIRGGAFVDEVYEKKGSYSLSQMGSKSITRLEEAYVSAEQVYNDANASAEARFTAKNQMDKIEAISETFVHDVGRMPATQQVGSGDDVHVETAGIEAQQPGATGQRVASSQGSAHLAERVYGLARRTGVIQDAPTGNHNIVHNPDSHNRQQK